MGGKLEPLPGARGESGYLKTAGFILGVINQVGTFPAVNFQFTYITWWKKPHLTL